ncbi:hypothetical protein [Nocardia sp. NPDC060249]|uniref:hypothetical protein n=1 Tax=Nocardia sp. NPDC060249 TaxID=3347082 RepID=UPI0036477F4E
MDDSPLAAVARTVWWVESVFVADVEYRELSGDGLLRHPVFGGSGPTRHPTRSACPANCRFRTG